MMKTAPPLDAEQDIVFARLKEYGQVIVEAAPGTGKTFTGISVALNAAREKWTSKERPSLFLTFSKNARVQIENELRHYEDRDWISQNESATIKISNYHAFFYELLKKRGGVWGLNKEFRPCTLEHRKENTKRIFKENKVKHSDYDKSICSPLCWNPSEIELPKKVGDEYRLLALNDLRNQRPHYDEFAPLVYNLLVLSTTLRDWLRIKYPLLILDEFQDSDCCQWEILKMWQPCRAAIFYDRHQMIYGWRKAKAYRIKEIIDHWKVQDEAQLELKTLHRTGTQKALAKFIVELRVDDLKGNDITPQEMKWLTLKRPPEWVRVSEPKDMARDTIRWEDIISYGETSAIICRTNEMVAFLQRQLSRMPSSKKGKDLKNKAFICKRIESESFDEKLRNYLHLLKSISNEYELRGWIGLILEEILPSGHNIDFKKRFAVDGKKLPENRGDDGPKSAAKRLLKPIWDEVSKTNIQAFLKALSLLPEIAKVFSADLGHPDYEAIGYIRNMSKVSSILPSDILWEDMILKLENSILKTSYLYLRQKPKGLFILNAYQAKGREFDHVIIPWLSAKGELVFKAKDETKYYGYYDYEKDEDRKLLYVAFTRAKKKITIIYPEKEPSVFLAKWKLRD